MSTHRFIEYLKYLRSAKGRHGVHSPFVYALIDNVIRKKRKIPLKDRLEAYFGKERFILLTLGEMKSADLTTIHADNVIAIPDIHHDAAATTFWGQLTSDENVTLSLDLLDIGLLLFSKDFKEKQHFVLKR